MSNQKKADRKQSESKLQANRRQAESRQKQAENRQEATTKKRTEADRKANSKQTASTVVSIIKACNISNVLMVGGDISDMLVRQVCLYSFFFFASNTST